MAGGEPGFEHDSEPLGGHRPGPEQAHRSDHGVGGRLVEIEVVGPEPDRRSRAGVGLVARRGQGRDPHRAPGGATRPGDAGAGGDGDAAGRVAERGDPHPGDPRVPASTRASRSRASAILRSAGRAATAGSNGSNGTGSTPSGSASPTHSSGSAKAALSRASASVSATTSGSRLAAAGEALTMIADDPDPDAGRGRRGERLDLAVVGLHGGVGRPADEGLDLLPRPGSRGHRARRRGTAPHTGRRAPRRATGTVVTRPRR